MLKHAFADVNGIRLHYAHAGSGPLMMFLHGFPEFWYEWRNLLPEFARDHHAVAPDMRGYNLSSKPADVEAYRMHNLVEDVRALAAQLGAERFTLVGHDWGGAVAWAFAIAHPAMLDRLIIINAPHPAIFRRELSANPAQQKASGYMQLLRSPEAERVLAADNFSWLRGALFGGKLFGSDEEQQAYVAAWSQPGALTGGLNYYRTMRPAAPAPAPADPHSAMVQTPVLVIWGERDTALLTGNLDGLEEFVPDLTVRRIPQGSHWVVHEQPTHVSALIREYMAPLPA